VRYVIDASVAVKWYIPEIFEREASCLLSTANRLHVPELLLPEFANIIWKKVRRGELTSSEGNEIVEVHQRSTLTIHSHRRLLRSAFLGASSTGQTVYDWIYLALAVSLSCEMVTADERFYNALKDTELAGNLKWIGDIALN